MKVYNNSQSPQKMKKEVEDVYMALKECESTDASKSK